MDTNMLLYVALIIYIIMMTLGFALRIKWFFVIAGIIWFIPITQIDDTFIVLVSVAVMILHFTLALHDKNESEF